MTGPVGPERPSARTRAHGRARLRAITAITGMVAAGSVAGIAISLHSASVASTDSDSTTRQSDEQSQQGDQLQAPQSNPQSTQQLPDANSSGS